MRALHTTVGVRSIETRPHDLASVFLNRAPSRAGQPAFFYIEFVFLARQKSATEKFAPRAPRAPARCQVSLRSVLGRCHVVSTSVPGRRHQLKSRLLCGGGEAGKGVRAREMRGVCDTGPKFSARLRRAKRCHGASQRVSKLYRETRPFQASYFLFQIFYTENRTLILYTISPPRCEKSANFSASKTSTPSASASQAVRPEDALRCAVMRAQ